MGEALQEVNRMLAGLAAMRKLESTSEENVKKLEAIVAEFKQVFPDEKVRLNALVADENGVTVGQLIASPNYVVLLDEYRKKVGAQHYEQIKKVLGLTDREINDLLFFVDRGEE